MFAAAATQLRQWATNIFDLGAWSYYGMDYTDVCRSDGEVQVFRRYRREVSIARQARQEVLSTSDSNGLDPAQLEQRIWCHAATVRDLRLPLPLKAN